MVYKKASFLASSQATEKETNACQVDQRFTCGWQSFIIFAHATRATGPRQRPFNYPPPGERLDDRRQSNALELACELTTKLRRGERSTICTVQPNCSVIQSPIEPV